MLPKRDKIVKKENTEQMQQANRGGEDLQVSNSLEVAGLADILVYYINHQGSNRIQQPSVPYLWWSPTYLSGACN